ncbi:hypothetical protein QN277_027169 [Acacia crassicarpa]|uniref:S-adenosyl-L-methionine-dependent methyltransferase superfamily protein n=1 Tax=Acacia crassicarpa TaxID=499986 RepID=A0AAE1MI65_9FABA|nr:hypothetical protein QN277_027169 [Acacia crassicarpa]
MGRCKTTWIRRFSTAVRRHVVDEGDWSYSSEWWGTESQGETILRATSGKGNGIVSVLAYPSSRPSRVFWSEKESWLKCRYEETHPAHDCRQQLRILGYQWRVLRFNDDTRQSAVKVMATYQETKPDSIYLMQQPHCLAVPYLRSMVSVGLATIASCEYDIVSVLQGKKPMHILCIGHGGGSLPLFLASKIQGAVIHIAEIDPLVISASIRAMGFPAFSVVTHSADRVLKPNPIDEVMWKGIHERLYLYEADAEKFIIDNTNIYDMVFIDAYDGDDIFPHKLWDSDSPFLKALSSRLHPEHGTAVVNLHSDCDLSNLGGAVPSIFEPILPMGKYVSRVCRAYKDVLLGANSYEGRKGTGIAFAVSVPWVLNTSLVVCRGFGGKGEYDHKDLVVGTLINKSLELEQVMNLPSSGLEYIKRDFVLVE